MWLTTKLEEEKKNLAKKRASVQHGNSKREGTHRFKETTQHNTTTTTRHKQRCKLHRRQQRRKQSFYVDQTDVFPVMFESGKDS